MQALTEEEPGILSGSTTLLLANAMAIHSGQHSLATPIVYTGSLLDHFVTGNGNVAAVAATGDTMATAFA
jgi:hypothetical protein